MGKISVLFEFGYIYIQGGGVNHPFRWTFSRLIYHIYKLFKIALLSFAIAYMQYINLKGNMLNMKQWLDVRHVFLSIYLSLI